eukprot:COSAG02_NODE_4909_length_4844_cov_3.058377_4_plen_92_part_00
MEVITCMCNDTCLLVHQDNDLKVVPVSECNKGECVYNGCSRGTVGLYNRCFPFKGQSLRGEFLHYIIQPGYSRVPAVRLCGYLYVIACVSL